MKRWISRSLPLVRHACRACLVAAVILTATAASTAAPFQVNAGYDLLKTDPGTSFPGLGPLMGVPLGAFDFGGGPVAVGNTDTIVHRLANGLAVPPAPGGTGIIPIELVALQLQSVAPVDFLGNGLDNYFVTLQSARGGPQSPGQLTVTWLTGTSGTLDSFFDVFFDIRKGSLAGPIVFSDELTVTSNGAAWTNLPPPGAVEITGVNTFLNGSDRENDFWPGLVQRVAPNGAIHVTDPATVSGAVPEPSTLVLAGIAGMLGLGIGWRKRR